MAAGSAVRFSFQMDLLFNLMDVTCVAMWVMDASGKFQGS
jgi:hypothetical protein